MVKCHVHGFAIAPKCKIPVTCDLEPVGVRCIDFITLIKESGEVFEGAGK